MKNKYKVGLIFIISYCSVVCCLCVYIFSITSHIKKYSNSDFNITTYKSSHDEDDDGIDDQTDILNNVKAYVSSKPKYKSKYYGTGYPNDHFGVCSDVVAFGLKDAGYDLMELVNQHVQNHKEDYDIDIIDKNIDFRRVQNLKIYSNITHNH